MSTIYRKYRPQTFIEVINREAIVQTLTNEIISGKIAHAYLFSGARGTGKTSVARLLAKAINCEKRKDGTAEPCNQCSACLEITAGRNIDVIEIDAASQTGVDNVRENIIENAQFKPTRSKYKIFIIDEVHMLSNSAFNALLKILEEPPAHVVFVLATTEIHKLPATVVSRCQRFSFNKISHEGMLKKLQRICQEEKVKIEKEVLEKIVAKSEGGMRDAESLLGQILALNLKKVTIEDALMILPSSNIEATIELAKKIQDNNAAAALKIINEQNESGLNFDQFILDLIEVWRQALLTKILGGSKNLKADFNDEARKKIVKLGQETNEKTLINYIDLAIKRRGELKVAPIPQLPLELLAVEAIGDTTLSDNEGEKTATTPLAAHAMVNSPVKSPAPASYIGLVETVKQTLSHFTHDEPIKTTLEQIQNKWEEIIAQVGQSNHSLTFILKMGTLKAVSGRTLSLTVPYSLHKEKLAELKNKKILEETLEKIFNEKISIDCLAAELKPEKITEPEIDSLATNFGGEIVG